MTPQEQLEQAVLDAHRTYRDAMLAAEREFDKYHKGSPFYAQARREFEVAKTQADRIRHASLVVAASRPTEASSNVRSSSARRAEGQQLTASEAGISVVRVHVPQDLYMQIRTYPRRPAGGFFSAERKRLTRARRWPADALPLPDGDAGLIEAERRHTEMRRRSSALYEEFKMDYETEAKIISAIIDRS